MGYVYAALGLVVVVAIGWLVIQARRDGAVAQRVGDLTKTVDVRDKQLTAANAPRDDKTVHDALENGTF